MRFVTIIAVFTASLLGGSFVHPLDFHGSKQEKSKVLTYIKDDVKKKYAAINMDDPLTLRMMEKKNLEAFKKLMHAKDRAVLDSVIKTYCAIDMCDYLTIEMMYRKQIGAKKEKLKW